jgi:hypothetical protein
LNRQIRGRKFFREPVLSQAGVEPFDGARRQLQKKGATEEEGHLF